MAKGLASEASWAAANAGPTPKAHVNLDVARRFADPSTPRSVSPCATAHRPTPCPERQRMPRSGEQVGGVWDALWRRGQIRIYANDAERRQALPQLAGDSVHSRHHDPDGMLMMADTREQTTALNGAIRDRLLAAGHTPDSRHQPTDRCPPSRTAIRTPMADPCRPAHDRCRFAGDPSAVRGSGRRCSWVRSQ